MDGDGRLREDDALLGINAAGDVGGCHLARGLTQLVGLLRHGDGMHIHDAEDAFILALHGNPVADSAQIIAQMQVAGGLYA